VGVWSWMWMWMWMDKHDKGSFAVAGLRELSVP